MNPTPIIDMFSGTGELARAVSAGLEEPTRPRVVLRQLQAHLMLQRGLAATNDARGTV